MARLGATLGARSRKIGSSRGAALALSGFAGLMVGSFEQLADRASDCFGISLRVAMDTLPAISLGAWRIAEPYLLGHLSVLGRPAPNFRALLDDRPDSRWSVLAGARLSRVQARS